MSDLVAVARELSRQVDPLEFAPPVAHVYNPLDYAWESHRAYLERVGDAPGRVVFLGMNPGPWGMVQTGVPFGDVVKVRDWIGIETTVEPPDEEHPKRPIEGFECSRREVSGTRFWDWAEKRFGSPERFFDRFVVLNYCPLAFLEERGRNRTPNHLTSDEKDELFEACDRALVDSLAILEPPAVVGIGRFAEHRARKVVDRVAERVGRAEIPVGYILHPSPASPRANQGWAESITEALVDFGIELE